MCRTTLNVGARSLTIAAVVDPEEGGVMFWLLLACKTAVPPAPPVRPTPPPIVLVDATTDALVAPPYTLVEVRADGSVSVSGVALPVVLPVGGDARDAPELVAALKRAKFLATNPNGPAVLVVDATMDVHAVRQTIYSSQEAGFSTLIFATQADPADPPGSMRGIRLEWSDRPGIILGALDKSLIDAVIKQNMNQIRYCYQVELKKQPALQGKITVKFVISATGSVSKAEIASSTMDNPTVESCIVSRFLTFQFPEPRGHGIVIVSYPFILTPG
jgi:hypothetical protein